MGNLKLTNRVYVNCPFCGHNTDVIIDISQGAPDHEERLIREFVDEICFTHPRQVTPATTIYENFRQWWENRFSSPPISQKKFGQILGKRFKREKSGTYNYFGIGLLSDCD